MKNGTLPVLLGFATGLNLSPESRIGERKPYKKPMDAKTKKRREKNKAARKTRAKQRRK